MEFGTGLRFILYADEDRAYKLFLLERNHPVNCRHTVSRTHAGIFCFGERSMCELHAQCFRKLDCKMIIVALQLITRFRLMRKQLVRTSVSYH